MSYHETFSILQKKHQNKTIYAMNSKTKQTKHKTKKKHFTQIVITFIFTR